ncbi:MAG TPA: arsenite methyltransferase [Thermoflexales bacterium]|nr:arsenite methyltransferase [Thermoflexales bacterium]HQZ52774.1 arsenite methyltransferase [Thermoflexales bacterium]
MTTENTIRDSVRESYAARARTFLNPADIIPLTAAEPAACCSAEGACCATSASAAEQGYKAEDVGALPADITEMTLGCGDPLSIAGLQPGQRVLDLGSGAGFDCFLAAQKVGDTGWVIGVDMTPEMLSLAWKNAARTGAHNVEFRYGHIEHLPVEAESIDVVLSNCVINLSPDKPAVFREAFRVLKPGGKFAVSDIVADREIEPAAQANIGSYCECVAGASEESKYLADLSAAGFREVRVTGRVPYADVPGSGAKTWSVKVEALK